MIRLALLAPLPLLAVIACADGSTDTNVVVELNCTDNVDNDADSTTDCDDADCADLAACGGGDTGDDTGGTDTGDTGDTGGGDDITPNLRDAELKITGAAAGDNAGFSIATGDLNGDGTLDFIVGAPLHDCDAGDGALIDSGAVYVMYGPVEGDASVTEADATICGSKEASDAAMGYAVTLVPDITGDGKTDLLAANPEESTGRVLVFSGSVTGTLSVDDAYGYWQGPTEGAGFGQFLGGIGTPDGDEAGAHLLIGSPREPVGAKSGAGKLWVLPVPVGGGGGGDDTANPGGGRFDLDDASLVVTGLESSRTASSALWADIDGDGSDDLIVGASSADTSVAGTGALYLGYDVPQSGGEVIVRDLGPRLDGTAEGEGDLGTLLVHGGDLNDDGREDFLAADIGASRRAGVVYIVYGSADPLLAGSIEPAAATRFEGDKGDDRFGHDVAVVPDMNGDGQVELVMGAIQHSDLGETRRGAVYVVSEITTGVNAIERSGFTMLGERREDTAGFRVASAGDLDGDGTGDIFLSAANEGSVGTKAGAAYVLLGKNLDL